MEGCSLFVMLLLNLPFQSSSFVSAVTEIRKASETKERKKTA